MGLFGFFTSAEEQRKQEVRTGARAPDRTERRKCWDARDEFFKCLDKYDVIDSTKDEGKKIAEKQCAKEHKGFEDNCAAAWVGFSSRLYYSYPELS
ncbi:cytochrome oxidase c subunit VIb-domain-containing protein [Rostrohypoxylon terebratum]|nr:cytochrome oxidase c subunit VIb-domain-containing protein [Rostrohypoxylon terebratum]